MARVLLAFVTVLSSLSSSCARPPEEPVVWSGTVESSGIVDLEFTAELRADSGTISIPMHARRDLPLTGVSVTRKELKFSIPSGGASWELIVADDGRSASGVMKQDGEFRTTMRRLGPGEVPVKEYARPQHPKPPFPYDVHEVEFENAPAGAKLSGTLTVPSGSGPFPCAVLVTGSGPQDRDGFGLGHRPFLVIADHLTRHGVAVLRYDDRGFGKSTGDHKSATSEDFAEDVLAAVTFLRARREIDGERIGLVGHSEGGLIAPICAAGSKDVSFLVILAGPGMAWTELIPLQVRLIAATEGLSAADADRQAQRMAEILALMVAGKSDAEVERAIRIAVIKTLHRSDEFRELAEEEQQKRIDQWVAEQAETFFGPWFRRMLVIDPGENLRKVTCPVLALGGEKDLQVPSKENLARIEQALRDGGNQDATILELPGLNHAFQTCTTGSPTEFARIEETFSPVALEAVTSWIRKRTKLE